MVLLYFSVESLMMKSSFVIIGLQFAACKKTKEVRPMQDINSLSHTKWNCKYHIVFASKYRRRVFYEEKRLEIEKILRELCKWENVNIITAEVCPDHVHMFLEIPPKLSVSSFMGYLKGKSSVMIY